MLHEATRNCILPGVRDFVSLILKLWTAWKIIPALLERYAFNWFYCKYKVKNQSRFGGKSSLLCNTITTRMTKKNQIHFLKHMDVILQKARSNDF